MLLRFSISARIASLGLSSALIRKIDNVDLQLEIILSLYIKFLYNFLNYRARFTLFNDIIIIRIGLLLIKL